MLCVVMMSTFNGEKYLHEQLCSILEQLPDNGELWIRDDGSSDRTVAIIRDVGDARIHLLEESNIGFARSFLELMRSVPNERDMYMLADQDDVWLPGKIERAWHVVGQNSGAPFLYCTGTQLVDENLRFLGVSSWFPNSVSFLNAFTENLVTGCTIAMNYDLLELATPKRGGEKIAFHDWWLYVVAVAFGSVFYDRVPTILYRQHAGNYIGKGVGLSRYAKMLTYLLRENWLRALNGLVEAFFMEYAERLSPSHLQVLRALQDSRGRLNRFGMLCSLQRHRVDWFSEFLFRCLLLLDWRSSR
jgi:glycosyltransferase involved in cell wall biosynthesis